MLGVAGSIIGGFTGTLLFGVGVGVLHPAGFSSPYLERFCSFEVLRGWGTAPFSKNSLVSKISVGLRNHETVNANSRNRN